MSEYTYQRYERVENNVNVIDAEHMNQLQETLERTQQELFVQADESFLSKALFTLEHHPDANAMLVDQMSTAERFNSASMTEVAFEEETKAIGFVNPTASEGSVVTNALSTGTTSVFKKIILLADQYLPEGSSIEYYLSFDNVSFKQIQPNQAIPAMTEKELGQLYLKVRFLRSRIEAEPRLDAWALLYQDETYMFRFLDNGLDIGIESDWDGTIVE